MQSHQLSERAHGPCHSIRLGLLGCRLAIIVVVVSIAEQIQGATFPKTQIWWRGDHHRLKIIFLDVLLHENGLSKNQLPVESEFPKVSPFPSVLGKYSDDEFDPEGRSEVLASFALSIN